MENPIFTRVSVRQYTDEPVTDEQVEQLMKAAMAAPSACNQQPWEFYLTRDDATKKALAACSPYAKPAANAALVIVPCIKEGELPCPEYKGIDLGICCENILLEAAALDLGAVWMGIYPDDERVQAVADAMGNPQGITPYALIAVGHPAEQIPPRSAKRYEPERVHWL